MGGRLTTPPPSASSSSTTAHRTTSSTSTTNLNHPRSLLNSSNHYSQQSTVDRRNRSISGHHDSRELFGNHSTNNSRQRATSHIDQLGTTAFNLNLLRYVGLDHESDDQSSEDNSPQARRRLPHFIIAFRDVSCPVCNKTIPSDSFDKHILQCLSKPRIDYNDDILTEDKGECVICLDDLLVGQKIARLPCLCIYHKNCIDEWFRINRTCPEHPGD